MIKISYLGKSKWTVYPEDLNQWIPFENAESMCEFLVVNKYTTDDELDKAILMMSAVNHNTAVFNNSGTFDRSVDIED